VTIRRRLIGAGRPMSAMCPSYCGCGGNSCRSTPSNRVKRQRYDRTNAKDCGCLHGSNPVILVNNRLVWSGTAEKKTPGAGLQPCPPQGRAGTVFGLTIPCRAGRSRCRRAFPTMRVGHGRSPTDIFAESPDRVFVTQKGELPVIPTGSEPPGFSDWAQHQSP